MTITRGTRQAPVRSFRKNRLAAAVSRRLVTTMSRTLPSWSTARHRYFSSPLILMKTSSLAKVPDELAFATKPQQAAAMLTRARAQGFPARWVAADEVYGGRDLRLRIRELRFDYAIAVPATHRVSTPAGRFETPAVLAKLPRRAWQRMRTGHGTKGDRHYV